MAFKIYSILNMESNLVWMQCFPSNIMTFFNGMLHTYIDGTQTILLQRGLKWEKISRKYSSCDDRNQTYNERAFR